MGSIRVFTDGSVLHNGKKHAIGGSGVFFGNDDPRNTSIGFSSTDRDVVTNQVTELLAAITALRTLHEANVRGVILYTDSKYVIQSCTTWCKRWMQNGWVNSFGQPVANKQLIQTLIHLCAVTNCSFKHVRSHKPKPVDENEYFEWYGNQQADLLAKNGMTNTTHVPLTSAMQQVFGRVQQTAENTAGTRLPSTSEKPLDKWFAMNK